jgi:hypothetical protein
MGMKVKLFEQYVTEVYKSKTKYSSYDEERADTDVKKLYGIIDAIVDKSPIAFDVSLSNDSFSVKGPFGLVMWIQVDSKYDPYDRKSTRLGVHAMIDKFKLAAETPEKLWKELKKSAEFKAFIKGHTKEKMMKDKLKSILKTAEKDKEAGKWNDDTLLDYLYYSTPEVFTNKQDNSGPWASSGTSIVTKTWNLEPLESALRDNVTEDVERLKTKILEKLGLVSSYMVDVKIEKFEVGKSAGTLEIRVATTVYMN